MFKIRLAQLEDSLNIYNLRISPEVSENSLNNSLFSYQSHQEWYLSTLNNSRRLLYVVTCSDEFAGVVRFDLDQQLVTGTVSIFFAKKFWGTGISNFGLSNAEEEVKKLHPTLKVLTAQVMSSNISSLKFFQKLKYSAPKLIELKKEL